MFKLKVLFFHFITVHFVIRGKSQTCEVNSRKYSGKPMALVYFDPDDQFEMHKTPVEALERVGYQVTLKASKEKLLGGWQPVEYVEVADEGFDFIWEPRSVTHQTQDIAQRIRKFPFIEAVPYKGRLAELNLDGHMKSFLLPQQRKELDKYLQDHPNPYWVVKNPYHHRIYVIELKKLTAAIRLASPPKKDAQKDDMWTSLLVQEFLENPFLIDDHKIDYSIFIAITSLFPLRLYASNSYTFVRKAKKPYFPLDPTDTEKTVVGSGFDGCGPLDMPSLNKYIEKGFSIKQSFIKVLEENGHDGNQVYENTYKVLVELFEKYLSKNQEKFKTIYKEKLVIDGISPYFELSRADFLLKQGKDGNVTPWLLEINRWPDTPVMEGPDPYGQLLRRIFRNLLDLLGATSQTREPQFFSSHL